MIVWLASYPRSGNTLLRTVLKQTMGLGSFSDEAVPASVGFTDVAREEIGHLPIEEPWEAFYERARAGTALHLVKTHLPPRDDAPAIYVVRDGRAATVSYEKYHRAFHPDHPGGLLHLLLGDDYYGGWSQHYAAWQPRTGPTLELRYEELVEASPRLLRSVADFIGYDGPVEPWRNPFERLNRENPRFFRQGDARWSGAPGWTPVVDGVFFTLHGELMQRLGYAGAEEAQRACAALPPEMAQFIDVASSLRRDKRMFEQAARERLAVIETLDAEVRRLRGAGRAA